MSEEFGAKKRGKVAQRAIFCSLSVEGLEYLQNAVAKDEENGKSQVDEQSNVLESEEISASLQARVMHLAKDHVSSSG